MLAVDIQYKYILQNVHSPTQRVHRNPPTGIYVPTFWGIHVSWRSSVHPSGAGLGNVHFVTYIFVSDICGQHLGDVCQLEVFCAPLMYILDICCPHLGNKCQLILYISPGPNCPGGPTVHFFRADSWAPDSWAPGPNCPGPNCPGLNCPGPNLPRTSLTLNTVKVNDLPGLGFASAFSCLSFLVWVPVDVPGFENMYGTNTW